MQRNFLSYILITLRGIAMGAADLIPGVSGGTIAFITGIYQELINSIKSVDKELFTILFSKGIKAAWKHINGSFLLALFVGIFISIFSLARLISFLLENHTMLVWAFFFGLIVASALYVGRKVHQWNWKTLLAISIGTVVAAYITIATPASTPETWWFILISGSIAITAMILPGISGSFILLLLGKYEYMINAVKDHDFVSIIIFGIGCLVGLLSFSKVISWLFKKYPDTTIALLTGFMLGSLNKLWPWKEIVSTRLNSSGELVPFLEKNISPFAYEQLTGEPHLLLSIIVTSLIGFLIIFVFDIISSKKVSKDKV